MPSRPSAHDPYTPAVPHLHNIDLPDAVRAHRIAWGAAKRLYSKESSTWVRRG
jgi:hypothetical protein